MLLAVDSSTQTVGLCLYEEGTVLAEMTWRTANHHTIELAPAIDALLRRCQIQPENLQVVAIALGPGSFTSLRIGLAFTKGLALSLHIPIIGIPTFQYLAKSQSLTMNPLLTVLPAGRGRLAAQWFINDGNEWVSDSEPVVLTPGEISESITSPTHICGEMGIEQRQIVGRKWKNAMVATPANSMRHPAVLAEMAWQRFKAGNVDNPVDLSPIYLHIAGALQE